MPKTLFERMSEAQSMANNQPTVTEADVQCARIILANPTMLVASLAVSDHREATTAELRAENQRLRQAVERARRHAENIGITDGSYIAQLDEALSRATE